MEQHIFDTSWLFTWILLPLLIFIARVFDVSIGTIRLIFVARGYKYLAPILGFFEVLIWITAISQIMQNLDNAFCYFAYAAGFAFGNYVGMWLEDKLSIGMVLVRIITQKDDSQLIEHLKRSHHGVTSVDADGLFSKVKIIFSITQRADLPDLVQAIQTFNPHAFYSIQDVRSVNEGFYPNRKSLFHSLIPPILQLHKKGK